MADNRVDPMRRFPPSASPLPTSRNVNLSSAGAHSQPPLKGDRDPAAGGFTAPDTRPLIGLDLAEQQTAVLRLVMTELVRWQNQLQPLYDLADDLWAKWFGKAVDPNTNPFLASMQVPYGMHSVEVTLPRILGDAPSLAYRAIDDEQDDLVAMMMGKVATTQLARMNFTLEAREFIRQALVTGYSIAKVGWNRQQEYVDTETHEAHPIIDPDTQDVLGIGTVAVPHRQLVVTRNEPFFETVNMRDFVWPLTAKSLDDATAVWQRRWVYLTELRQKQQAGVYQNVEQLSAMDSPRWLEAYGRQYGDQGLSPQMPEAADPENPDHALIEVWERWEDDRLTVIANRRVLLRDEVNPFQHKKKPFVDYAPIPRPFQMHGLGVMSVIDDSNEHLNTLMRQVCDAITYTINPMWQVSEGVQTRDIVHIPGGNVRVPDGEAIEPMNIPQVDLSGAMALRQAILEDMQRTTGAFELIGGAFPFAGSRTATGMATIVQEGARRVTEMLEVFNRRTMVRFGWLLMRMNEQYLDQDTLVSLDSDPKAQEAWTAWQQQMQGAIPKIKDRVINYFGLGTTELPAPSVVKVPPDLLRASGRLEPIPEVGTDKVTNDQQKQSAATQFIQALAPMLANPQFAGQLDGRAVIDWLGQQFDVPKDVRDRILKPDGIAELSRVTDAMGGAPAESGPGGGNNSPMGGVAGTPGAAGPIGPPGLS